MDKIFLKICFAFSLTPLIGHAQLNDSTKITVADVITFHSKILNEDRKIYVHTPIEDTTYLPQSYPVFIPYGR